jgi:hypothetical protein
MHDVYWQATRWLALEHLQLVIQEHAITADGLIVGRVDGAPLRLQYRLTCDAGWSTTALRVDDLASGDRIELTRDELDAAAAVDVDIAATPFTNTLPIRRLALDPGDAAEITVVFVAVTPALAFRPVRQRYTRLADRRYLYESLESDFKRELLVDEAGLVVDYPGIWQRVIDPNETD